METAVLNARHWFEIIYYVQVKPDRLAESALVQNAEQVQQWWGRQVHARWPRRRRSELKRRQSSIARSHQPDHDPNPSIRVVICTCEIMQGLYEDDNLVGVYLQIDLLKYLNIVKSFDSKLISALFGIAQFE